LATPQYPQSGQEAQLMLKFLQLLSPSTFGIRMIEAAEAFETLPLSRSARRHAVIALCCLLAGATLLVTAALVDTFANIRPLSEACGWAGIACLVLCVCSGLRYKAANRRAARRVLPEQVPETTDSDD
jgi:hypothetical protein